MKRNKCAYATFRYSYNHIGIGMAKLITQTYIINNPYLYIHICIFTILYKHLAFPDTGNEGNYQEGDACLE